MGCTPRRPLEGSPTPHPSSGEMGELSDLLSLDGRLQLAVGGWFRRHPGGDAGAGTFAGVQILCAGGIAGACWRTEAGG